MWQWFSYIKVWSHWTYSSQNVGRKHLFLAQGEERRKKRGALESWSTEGTAISAWKGFEATVWWSTWRRLSRPFHHPLVLLYTRWWHTPHTALWKHTYNSWTKRRNGICNIRIWNYFFNIKKVFLLSPNIIKIIYYEYDLYNKYNTQSHFHLALFPELVNINLF